MVAFTENLPAPVGYMDVTTVAEKAKEADSSLIIKVGIYAEGEK